MFYNYLRTKQKPEKSLLYIEKYIRVRPGLDSLLDILEPPPPPLEPTGILDLVFVGVRNADDK